MALDAAAYPHILDAVLAHAQWDALLSLRGVSKALLARDSVITYAHVAIRVDHAADGAAVQILDPYTFRRIPGLRFDASRDLEHRLTLARLAQYVVTLDVLDDNHQCPLLPRWIYRRLRACFANIKTLRCTSVAGLLFARSASTVVFFHRLTVTPPLKRPYWPDIIEWPLERLVVRLEIPQDLLPDPERGFDANGQPRATPLFDALYALRMGMMPTYAAECIVLASQGSDAPPRYSVPEASTNRFRLLIFTIFVFMNPKKRMRVAGLETIDPGLMGLEVAAQSDASDRIAAICAVVREMLADPSCPVDYLETVECTTAVTLGDYRDAVVADEWVLSNTWPGGGLPMPSSWARGSA
ncbi:uncharacterized protein LOC62_07G008943 [Vanrija pseudolonga]|uniref:Uncharacterized protein n=1 Tax=Vanrija pseudolonga TaxID=143232 RepID=A0AAF0YHU0_9TREE|nr:hypothetical protein LOC62_07G008943 [Vanrija pseudolonga]